MMGNEGNKGRCIEMNADEKRGIIGANEA